MANNIYSGKFSVAIATYIIIDKGYILVRCRLSVIIASIVYCLLWVTPEPYQRKAPSSLEKRTTLREFHDLLCVQCDSLPVNTECMTCFCYRCSLFTKREPAAHHHIANSLKECCSSQVQDKPLYTWIENV